MADKEPLLDVSRGDSGEEEVASSKKGASTVATFLFFLKSYLGSGIMGMAGAYLNGGIYPVTILVFSMAVLSGLCFLMLFHVRDDILASKKSPLPRDQLQFEAIVAHVLGKWGGRAVMAAVIFTQYGSIHLPAYLLPELNLICYPTPSPYLPNLLSPPGLALQLPTSSSLAVTSGTCTRLSPSPSTPSYRSSSVFLSFLYPRPNPTPPHPSLPISTPFTFPSSHITITTL